MVIVQIFIGFLAGRFGKGHSALVNLAKIKLSKIIIFIALFVLLLAGLTYPHNYPRVLLFSPMFNILLVRRG